MTFSRWSCCGFRLEFSPTQEQRGDIVRGTIRERSSLRKVGLAVPLLCALLLACGEEPEQAEIIRPVKAIKVHDTEGLVVRSFPGRAAATQEINASFRVSGQLIARPIDVGTEVKAGELIAALDPDTFQTAVAQAEADVASKKAASERADIELSRQLQLFEKGWVTEVRVDTVRATALAKRAAVDAAQAALQRAELDLSYTTLTAPFDGIVVETYVENFQEVLAKQPVARLVDDSQIEFWVAIPEGMISLVPYARDITVVFEAFPGRPLPATVKEIKAEASQTTRAYDVNLIMDQPDDFWVLPGMAGRATAARIDVPESQRVEGYEVPLAAIYSPKGDEEFVWVISEGDMTVSPRPVSTIEMTRRGVRVEGVTPGEWIVVAGVDYLREGQKVRFEQ